MLITSSAPSCPTSLPAGPDDAVWQCLLALLGEEDAADPEVAAARRVALLPARLLQCAYWAALADALPAARAPHRPDATARCLAELAAGPAAAAACVSAAAKADCALGGAGWHGRASWKDVHNVRCVRHAHCDLYLNL